MWEATQNEDLHGDMQFEMKRVSKQMNVYVAWQIEDSQLRFITRCSVTRLSSQATPNIDLRPTHRVCLVTSLFWSLHLRDVKRWGVISKVKKFRTSPFFKKKVKKQYFQATKWHKVSTFYSKSQNDSLSSH